MAFETPSLFLYMTTILVICSGNTCRSPVGEAILKQKLAENGLSDWVVRSAGTRAVEGQPASTHGVELCRELFDIDLSAHQSKKVDSNTLNAANLVLCMTAQHQKDLLKLDTENQLKIKLLAEMYSEDRFDVPDPFGQDKEAYRRMITTVSNLIDEGLPSIIELVSA